VASVVPLGAVTLADGSRFFNDLRGFGAGSSVLAPRADLTVALSHIELEAIKEFDTCTIANAIERFNVRLRNEGFTKPGLKCVTLSPARLLGYAVTCRIRSSNPPLSGRSYLDRTDWWDAIKHYPAPRVVVIQDVDSHPGTGTALGEVHAAILKAFDCGGVITNGAVRDVPAVKRLRFPMFAPMIGVSHSYMHLIDCGEPVELFGLKIHSGDLLYADCHGVISIPHKIATEVPAVAAQIREREKRIIDLCQSPDFSAERLLGELRSVDH
jgi:4-hydroxy-4-methyl-2-oxoglutarate aldolase